MKGMRLEGPEVWGMERALESWKGLVLGQGRREVQRGESAKT